jgi:hypothetical protein
MRDDSTGEVVKNAHLLGFFRRIVKLLCIRVRPVFVFDGATPALKRQTVLARRAQRKHADTRLKVVAEKLLIQRMREHAALVVRAVARGLACAHSSSRVPRCAEGQGRRCALRRRRGAAGGAGGAPARVRRGAGRGHGSRAC